MLTVASSQETQIEISAQSLTPEVMTSPEEEETIFRSHLPNIAIPDHLPLHTFCFEKSSAFPDRPCIINGPTGEVFTFAETHLLCRRAAAGFRRLGIHPGDVIMILLQNSPEFVFTFMGAAMIGAASTTANPFCTPEEILKQFNNSGAKLVVTQSAYADKFRTDGFSEDLVIVTIDAPTSHQKDKGCVIPFSELIVSVPLEAEEAASVNPESAVAIPFSSGTTGLPKGVILTHKCQVASIAQQVDGENPNLYLKEEDVTLCVLPLFHVFSLNSVLLCSLRSGSAVLIMPKFEIASMLRLIEKHRVTVAAVVPPLVLALAKDPTVESYDLSSIRIVLSGAAPLRKELEEALHALLPNAIFGQGYGMTEAGPVLSMCPAFSKVSVSAKPGSCGTVVRNAELKVVDPDNGLPLRRNLPGEICIRGPQIMKGYLNDPDASARTIDVQGWLHTGDIGYVDDDNEVFIVDRVKELIKFKGFQVPPAELENLLVSHPSIVDAAVVPQKDAAAGEVPVAFVVQAKDSEDISEDAVKEFIAKQVVFYKKLHKVHFINAIPKSVSGKILRKELKARLATPSHC